jgi:hypothetical protein
MDTNLIILIVLMAGALVGLWAFSRKQRVKNISRAVQLAQRGNIAEGQVYFVPDNEPKTINVALMTSEGRTRHDRGRLVRMNGGQYQTAELGENMDPSVIPGERFANA